MALLAHTGPVSVLHLARPFAPLQNPGVWIAQLLHPAPANPQGKKPVVYIMDNRDRVYNAATKDSEATNAHDIDQLLRRLDIPMDTRVETVYPGWAREDVIVNADPDLIIIHWSCFMFKNTSLKRAENSFKQFVNYVARQRKKVHFLVYSRRKNIIQLEPGGGGRYLMPRYYEDKLGITGLRERIHPFHATPSMNSFQDEATRIRLKDEVRKILEAIE
jgi:hypothetical protein